MASETPPNPSCITRSARSPRIRGRVHVVAPALNPRVRHSFSDTDAVHEAAEVRLTECLEQLASLGLEEDGHVGDADPLQAIDDALVTFPATELMIALVRQAQELPRSLPAGPEGPARR